MDNLLQLLDEARVQLMEMWMAADDSVADYIIEIQTAVNFINKALDTEDRLDVFRALQKAHDALEKEYDETPPDEEYDDLVDRLKAALNGLNENVYMKKSELKAITKAVLKEIADTTPLLKSFGDIFGDMQSSIKNNMVVYNDISYAHKAAHNHIDEIVEVAKHLVFLFAKVGESDEQFLETKTEYNIYRQSLMELLIYWTRKINEKDHSKVNEIDKIMGNLNDSIKQTTFQVQSIFTNLKTQSNTKNKNYITVIKEFNHLNEIFKNIKTHVDDLFELGLKAGVSQPEK